MAENPETNSAQIITRCQGTSKSGRSCGSPPRIDKQYCLRHDPSIPKLTYKKREKVRYPFKSPIEIMRVLELLVSGLLDKVNPSKDPSIHVINAIASVAKAQLSAYIAAKDDAREMRAVKNKAEVDKVEVVRSGASGQSNGKTAAA